jgi:cytochrome c oxidase subunit 3
VNPRRGRNVFSDPVAEFSAGRFGMMLLLLSLGTLFAASVLGYVILRLQASGAMDAVPPLPRGLWISTLLLVASSGTIHMALLSARRGAQPMLRGMLALSMLLGVAFLFSQYLCWQQLLAQHRAIWEQVADVPRFMIASFYVLTAVHAAHVMGGLIPLSVVTWRSFQGRYNEHSHAGVYYCGMYWHFLDGVWIVLFVTLLLGT